MLSAGLNWSSIKNMVCVCVGGGGVFLLVFRLKGGGRGLNIGEKF